VVGGLALLVSPASGVFAATALGVAWLIWRSPAYGFLAALSMIGVEGSLKLALGAQELPFAISAEVMAAAFIDVSLFGAIAVLVLRDRGRTLRRVWDETARWERVAFGSLGAWLLLSVAQIAQSGDLLQGLMGFRLTQAYVAAALAGLIVLWPGRGRDATLTVLLAIVGAVSAYAAVRVAVGPTIAQINESLTRNYSFSAEVFRAVGSFSSPIGLAGFITPAGAFAVAVAFLRPRYRPLGLAIAACALVAIIASYQRVAIVAFAASLIVMAAYALSQRRVSARSKRAVVVGVASVLAVGAVGTAVAGAVSPVTAERARGLLVPLQDEAIRDRLELWGTTIAAVGEQPLGAGLGQVGRATGPELEATVSADNSYLKVLFEQGVLGGFLFVVGVIGAAIAVGRRLAGGSGPDWALGVAALCGFVAFLVMMVTGEYIESPGKVLAWTLLGVAAAQAFGSSSHARSGEPS